MKALFLVECEIDDAYVARKGQPVEEYTADAENSLSDALVYKDYIAGRPKTMKVEYGPPVETAKPRSLLGFLRRFLP